MASEPLPHQLVIDDRPTSGRGLNLKGGSSCLLRAIPRGVTAVRYSPHLGDGCASSEDGV